MTDKELLAILEESPEPESAEDIFLSAYQLGRYFGRNEYKLYFGPADEYEALCDLVCEKTEVVLKAAQQIISLSIPASLHLHTMQTPVVVETG